MKSIKVTKLQNQVLQSMAAGMYAEFGFSDYGLTELIDDTKIKANVLRGVASSLIKKGLIEIDEREDEGFKNDTSMHIWYLKGDAQSLVPHWHEEIEMEKIELITE